MTAPAKPTLVDYYGSSSAGRAKGHRGVLRYIAGGSEGKHITSSEVKYLHRRRKAIGLQFEQDAQRAREGREAGIADREATEVAAASLGYPKTCPIFFCVDFEGTWAEVAAYFDGVQAGGSYPHGVYAGYDVIDGASTAHPKLSLWQTSAWSDGRIHALASIYQEAYFPSYDISVVRRPVTLWGRKGPVVVPTPPKPVKPPKPGKPKETDWSRRASVAISLLLERCARRIVDKHPLTAKSKARALQLAAALTEVAKVE